MKKLKLWLVILPMSAIGCSDENSGERKATSQTEMQQTSSSSKTSRLDSDNPANPFDRAGKIYSKILDTLDHGNFQLHCIKDAAVLIDSVSKSYPELNELSADVFSKKIPEITWIINNNNHLDAMLLNSNLGAEAQSSILLFERSLMLSADYSYKGVYSMIVSYEESIQEEERFSSEDKRIMLTTASIVRNSVKRKRKDKDWETSVTKISASVLEADQDFVLSIKMALTVGICQKYNVKH